MKTYLDDCAYAKVLAAMLRAQGHQVRVPHEARTTGMDDSVHLQYAIDHDLVILTKNPHDFELLHKANANHPGILAIYQDNDPSRDMNYAEIVRAIANIEAAAVPIHGEFHVLNHWRY